MASSATKPLLFTVNQLTAALAALATKQPVYLLSPGELAVALGTSRAGIYRLDAAGKIPQSVKLGSVRKWRRPEIEQWVAMGCPSRAQWAREHPEWRD